MRKLSKAEAGKLGAIASKKIQQKQKQFRIDGYSKNPSRCIQCNKAINYQQRKNKFCNKSCSAKYNNTRREKKLIVWYCQYCSEKHVTAPNRVGKYCNLQCQQDYAWKQRKIIVLEGKGLSGNVKRYLLETYGHKCNKCKNIEWNNQPIPLELEHKDGNSENNSLNNVEMLCPNCHAQTPTYKGKNKGNGRHVRRHRYKEEKSYQ